MESTAFFEKKISITPSDFNKINTDGSIDALLLEKAKDMVESKCSEQGFVVPGSVTLISRSMGYFESARFTGDAVYYVKLEGRVVYPVDGTKIIGKVTRKNKMGLYVNYNDSIHIQVPRDLHLGNQEYDQVEVGDEIEVELKRSKFAINDPYILASGLYLSTEQQDVDQAEEQKEEPIASPIVPLRMNRVRPIEMDQPMLSAIEAMSNEVLLQQYKEARTVSDQQAYRDALFRVIQQRGLEENEVQEVNQGTLTDEEVAAQSERLKKALAIEGLDD